MFLFLKYTNFRNLQRKRDYDPLPWDTHYDTSEDIQLDLNTFHIYTRGTEGPILVLLHGGGYSALTWAEFSVSICIKAKQILSSNIKKMFLYNSWNFYYSIIIIFCYCFFRNVWQTWWFAKSLQLICEDMAIHIPQTMMTCLQKL